MPAVTEIRQSSDATACIGVMVEAACDARPTRLKGGYFRQKYKAYRKYLKPQLAASSA